MLSVMISPVVAANQRVLYFQNHVCFSFPALVPEYIECDARPDIIRHFCRQHVVFIDLDDPVEHIDVVHVIDGAQTEVWHENKLATLIPHTNHIRSALSFVGRPPHVEKFSV